MSTCRMLMVGGSAAPPALIRAFADRHGIDIVHGWGMTETSPVASLAVPPARVEPGSEEFWRYKASQGRLLCGVEARLVGPDGSVVPADGESVGEVEVRGPWITGAYYSNGTESQAELDEMAAKFDDGWLRTGDVGRLPPTATSSSPTGPRTSSSRAGSGSARSTSRTRSWPTPTSSRPPSSACPTRSGESARSPPSCCGPTRASRSRELREFLEGRVAHWQVPERWAVIDEVPKTSVGKFDKKVLRSRYAAGELEVHRAG